ncbi:MAG: endolytic transglycosylase MltG [Thermodesulfobacteriota bacterium]
MKHKISLVLTSILVLLLTGTLYIYQYITLPMHYPGEEKNLTIYPDSSFSAILDKLHSKGILKDKSRFRILAKATGKASSVKAGEYRINTEWSRLELLQTLSKGQTILRRLQIPEGLAWWEIAQKVENSGIGDYESFRRAVHNQTLLKRYNIPFETAEGFLFPETYNISKAFRDSSQQIVEIMLTEFWEQTKRHLWGDKLPDPERIRRVVILASMIEKETSIQKEMGKIAGVFKNRLEKGMYLQCDPTVIYGIGRDFNGNLQTSDLKNGSNPYNTYRQFGLPPTPICSPGISALKAAKNPEDHSYLYFVSKGNGEHKFSRNLREHNNAVRKYLLK